MSTIYQPVMHKHCQTYQKINIHRVIAEKSIISCFSNIAFSFCYTMIKITLNSTKLSSSVNIVNQYSLEHRLDVSIAIDVLAEETKCRKEKVSHKPQRLSQQTRFQFLLEVL